MSRSIIELDAPTSAELFMAVLEATEEEFDKGNMEQQWKNSHSN